jgi:hypothetical protein
MYDHAVQWLLAGRIDTGKVFTKVVEDGTERSAAFHFSRDPISLPKETPDVGGGKVDPFATAVLVDLDLLHDRSIGEDDHLIVSLSL